MDNTNLAPPASALEYMGRRHRNLIGDRWTEAASGQTFKVLNPATGQAIATVAEGDSVDIDLAVEAARRSFDQGVWRSLLAEERACAMWCLADLVDRHSEELYALEILHNGMPMFMAQASIGVSARTLRYMAGAAGRILGVNASSAMSGGQKHIHAYTTSQPVGVAGMILPWNAPLATLALKVAPALAAGCSVVIKPAENTPITALRFGELVLEAGIPPGVVNIVTGLGGTAGAALARHPKVDKISFTGSTAVGKEIVRTAANDLKRVTLELGGKSPCLIFDDADLDTAIPAAAMAIFVNSGQICFAGSRLFVQHSIYERVLQGVADFAAKLKIGNGFDPSTMIGPLISEKQRSRVESYIGLGVEAGAELVQGGRALPGPGYFLEPTVFSNVQKDMRIVREEIFGPVLVATPFRSIDEVVTLANDTRYGLGAGIFTTSVDKAHRVAALLESGNVWVNGYGVTHPSMPFGGVKESGWGRENGEEGLSAFLETKSVFITLS